MSNTKPNRMFIAAVQRFSLIEYPGKISCVVFTQGCNFRCSYCFNPELIPIRKGIIAESEVLSFLERRRSLLDAVVLTGGEPLLHEIADFINAIKQNFLVGLVTNGSFPERLLHVIDSVDFVAMDVKAPPHKYENVVGVKISPEKIMKSISIIMKKAKDYEFRTTVVKTLSKEDVMDIGRMVEGAKKLVLQRPRSAKGVYVSPRESTEIEELRRKLERYVQKCIVR